MQTYIIKTESNEFYCGKTNDLDRRMKQHKLEKKPHWFGQKLLRKNFRIVCLFSGDYEKQIKRAGIEFIYNLMRSAS